jgi:hypothetical protein
MAKSGLLKCPLGSAQTSVSGRAKTGTNEKTRQKFEGERGVPCIFAQDNAQLGITN